MRLITCSDLGFTWRKPFLLDQIQLAIDSGDRIGLLGRNGTGKSTLLKLLAGEIEPDHGTIRRYPNLKIARLIQEVPGETPGTIGDVVRGGWQGEPIEWKVEAALHRTLTRMQLDGTRPFESLSAGMKRRALLGRAIIGEPELLLLDEPTNHLDIESILWLEGFLKSYSGAFVFVTHDRAFLRALARRILEVDRGRLLDWECDYSTFLQRKEEVLAAEEKQEALFDKRLAEEEVWIRQGIKARRTRNEGRVRALEAMRRERSARRQRIGDVRLVATTLETSGQLVVEMEKVSFAYANRPIVKNFSTLITRGDKIGIVGPNGAGKTTLIKLILGQLAPAHGRVRHGTRLDILYFDQLREQIDGEKSVADNVSEGEDRLVIGGKERHIYGYLQDFLFTPDRARQPAKFLSGGERNRLLLARLFRQSSNFLILDEPTNDLDAETLELLEELVSNYEGTLLLVSHDREFLNNVVTSVIALDGEGNVHEYGGGYEDYARNRTAKSAGNSTDSSKENRADPNAKASPTKASSAQSGGKTKLTFKEAKELEGLPAKIESLERDIGLMHEEMAQPQFYQQPAGMLAQHSARLKETEASLEGLLVRWEELEEKNS